MEHPMKRRIRSTLIILLAGLTLGATCLGLILGTEKGRQGLLDTITWATSGPDFTLQMTGLRLSDTWTVEGITISDASGPWLDVRNLSVRPVLTDLLKGKLFLLHAGIARLEITRLPKSEGESQSRQDQALPPLRIQAVDIEHVRLGPDVVGHEALLSLHGSLALDQDEPRAALRVARLDRTDDVLDLDARLHLPRNTLDLRLDLHEGPQGLLHAALGVNGTQGIWLSASGNGPLEAWNLALESSISDVARLTGNATLALNANPGAELHALITPGPAWSLFTGLPHSETAIQAQGEWRESVLRINLLDLRSPIGTLEGNATWDSRNNVLESEARARDVDLTWLMPEGIEAGPFHASASLRRDSLGLRAQGSFQVRDAVVSGYSVPEAQARLDLDMPADTASWRALTHIEAQTPDLPDGLRSWTANATLGQDSASFFVDNLRLESERLGLAANATLDSLVHMDARFDIRELPLGDALSPVSATVDTTLSGQLDLAAPCMNASLEAHVVGVEGLPPEVMDLLGQGGTVLAELSLTPQRIVLSEAKLRARTTADASAQVDLDNNSFTGRLEATLPQIKADALQVSSGAKLQAAASGTPESFALDLSLSAANMNVREMALDSLTATASVKNLPGRPVATVRAGATVEKEPVSLDLQVESAGKSLRFKEALLQLPDTSLRFSGDLDPDTLLLAGDANFQSTDLSALGRMLGMNLGGDFSLEARLDASRGRQRARLKGQGASLSAQNIGVGSASISGTLTDPRLPQETDVEIELLSAGFSDLVADQITARLRGTDAGTSFTVGLAHYQSKSRLTTSGTLSSDLARLVIDDLQGTLLQQDVRLQSPLDVTTSASGARWRETVLRFGPSTLRTKGEVSAESADISADLTAFDPALLRPLLPGLPTASVNAQLSVKGAPTQPDAHLRVQAENIRLDSSDMEQLRDLDATADLRLLRNALEAQASLTSQSDIKLNARLASPMPVNLLAPEFPQDAPLSGQLTGRAKLLLLPRLFHLDDQTLDGNCDLDFSIAGTWEHPSLMGTAQVQDARYENFRSGTILQGINMDAQAEGSTLTAKLSATDGGEGTAEAVGQVDLPTLRYVFDVFFDRFRLLRQDLVQSTAKGGLRLQGDLQRTELRGNMSLDPTTVRLPAKTPADLAHIEVQEINTDKPLMLPRDTKSDFQLDFDLKVAIPARMTVQGRGLESEWSGDLHVGGNHVQPVISGEMKLLRGKFDFLDRTFDLTKGSVALSGEHPPNPFLEVLGETQILENLIQVRINGPARNFRVSLTSVPTLPQDELLALILFGRSLRQISPLQAVRLAQAAAEMTGLGGATPDFLDSIKSSLGLQEVDVSRDDQDNTAVGIGGYVGGKYYIRTQSSVSGQDRTRVEIQLTPKISVETEVGSDSRQGGGVTWKHDY
jgi:translocation and assembly module TamB